MIINGDSLEVLKGMPENSVHCCITSPPYYGLRKYGLPPVTWGGDKSCEHVWEEVHPPGHRKSDTNPGPMQHEGNKNREQLTSDICSKCGAWKGELGLEPTPEMYVSHLVEIFREVRRVLRPEGLFWLNIGDSYASGKGSMYNPGGNEKSLNKDAKNAGAVPLHKGNRSTLALSGLKPKDLMEIPSDVSRALRLDGWYLRARLPWIKRNSMPSSVEDRPAASIEYVFLLAKSRLCFYDRVAVLQRSSESYNNDKRPRGILRQRVNKNSKYPDEGQFKKQDEVGNPQYTGFNERYAAKVAAQGVLPTRNFRDSDLFFKTWQGLLHNEDGEPMALVVNPRSYKGAHFASFPLALVEPMIVASTSEKGCCPSCGAPWKRIVTKESYIYRPTTGSGNQKTDQLPEAAVGLAGTGGHVAADYTTIGWEPSCKCYEQAVAANNTDAIKAYLVEHPEDESVWKMLAYQQTIPCTVLDPFGGSGATGAEAEILGRSCIIIELKSDYCALAQERIKIGK